jgi:uncharacterized protein (TIGR03086 family)
MSADYAEVLPRDLPDLHRRSLAVMDRVLAGLDPAALERPTPCVDWTLQTLLEHVAGQNAGLARAFDGGDADLSAWAPLSVDPHAPSAIAASNAALADSIASAVAVDGGLTRSVWMPEIRPHTVVPGVVALRAHLLDTVVHSWDIAAALGHPERADFDDDVLDEVWSMAVGIQDGDTREASGFFGRSAVDDATLGGLSGLARIVAWLGRVPDWAPAVNGSPGARE